MRKLVYLLLVLFISSPLFGQVDTLNSKKNDTLTYRILKSDGGEFVGKILEQDEREVLFLTTDGRRIIIPQYVIEKIETVDVSQFNTKGDFIGEDKFATRYFITTNGLPINKGEHYIQWNLFGPDIEFGVGKNLGVGIMTSWMGIPIIGTIKKSWRLSENSQFAIGALVGTGSWGLPEYGGALPYGTLSFGNRSANIAFSGGYGALALDGNFEGRTLSSVAGMVKISPKISLIFDSFILLPGPMRTETVTHSTYEYNPSTMQNEYITYTTQVERRNPGGALLVPGIRWHQDEGKAVQFGFAGIIADGEILPVPIPMVQRYRSL
tara:strand:+ start:110577 stop:111545 length:969 start_codon:yes stop_codon:yes gene_type:complete